MTPVFGYSVKGIEKGVKVGIEMERLHALAQKREAARKMLLAGIKAPQIADFLGLTEKEVIQIAEELGIF